MNQQESFSRFLKRKWFILLLLTFLTAWFAVSVAGGFLGLQVLKFTALSLIGVGHSLIVMYLWYRIGAVSWLVIGAQFVLQTVSAALMRM